MKNMGLIDNFGKQYTFRRFGAGTRVKGVWTNGDLAAPVTFTASIQPLTYADTMKLPEGERTKDYVRIYTTTQLRQTSEQDKTKGDIVDFKGRRYEVQKVAGWPDVPPTSDLTHFKFIASRFESDI